YLDIANKLFQEEFVSIQPEEYTQFLAAGDEESTKIRSHYMNLFDWDANLLKSTRMLCAKLYLKGESQEIDRILSSFTKSYIKQHPQNVFCTRNFEKIYIIIYSLILLNTALHNSELNKKSKISQPDYIKNTFTTFIQQNPKSSKKLSIKQRIIIERELSNFYEELSKNELHLKQSEEESNEAAATTSSRLSTPDASESSSNGQDSELPLLSRQVSNSSIWSTDSANRRSSLAMKRMSSATSAVSQYTVTNNNSGSNGKSNRVGFTRALASDLNQKFYKNGNSSRTSNVSTAPFTIRNRQSLDYLRGAPTTSLQTQNSKQATPTNVHGNLHKRASRSSIISKESTNSVNGDDTMSVLSLDTVNLNNLDLGDDFDLQASSQRQQLEDFNVDDYQDQYDLTLELQGSPYLKEGLLKLRIMNNDQQDTTSSDLSNGVSSSATSTTSHNSTGSRFLSFFSRAANNTNTQPNKPSSTVGTSTNLLANKLTENFVVVSKGELSLYSFDQKIIKKHQQKIRKYKQKQLVVITELDEDEDDEDQENIGDGNWLKNAVKIGNYNLCSTFAQIENQSNSTKKAILWSLVFPKTSKKPAKKFIFEAGTMEIALEFVNTCNFWAAKITAIPTLEESVSSIEYGWTNLEGIIAKKDQFKKMKHIMKWEQLPKGIYLSNYIVANLESDTEANHEGMMKQFVKTLTYYNHLKKLYHEFTKDKLTFLKSLPMKQYNCSNYSKITSNYNAKVHEYKGELTKYKNYLIILGFGLQLRFDLEDQDKEAEHVEESVTPKAASIAEDDELTKLVKLEIRKLFINMKDVSKIIPTFQSSKSINNLTNLIREQNEEDSEKPTPLVKSPKTFKLSNYKDTESPVNQLLQSTNAVVEQEPHDVVHSYSTNTIKEEEEPE
ncbi:uncharacterized protein CANTADRAFT_35488, partial [Suhomyces tanzawaensis NRRL Y-17324]